VSFKLRLAFSKDIKGAGRKYIPQSFTEESIVTENRKKKLIWLNQKSNQNSKNQNKILRY